MLIEKLAKAAGLTIGVKYFGIAKGRSKNIVVTIHSPAVVTRSGERTLLRYWPSTGKWCNVYRESGQSSEPADVIAAALECLSRRNRPLTAEEVRLILEARRTIEPDGCWSYTGTVQRGRGVITMTTGVGQKRYLITRLAAFAWLGANIFHPNFTSQVVRKVECKNSLCFHPDHLMVLTPTQAARYLVKHGVYPSGPDSYKAHASYKQAQQIIDALNEGGETHKQIAERVGVPLTTVKHIAHGGGYRNVEAEIPASVVQEYLCPLKAVRSKIFDFALDGSAHTG